MCVYIAASCPPSAISRARISFHCVSPAVSKQKHCLSFTLTDKNNFHQQSCTYLLPKEDILPVPLYIGHLLRTLHERLLTPGLTHILDAAPISVLVTWLGLSGG